MDLHPVCLTLAQRLGVTVLAYDIPGTGESPAPLSVKGDEIVLGIVSEARKIGNGKAAYLGFSFGGNFSAMTGLSGAVDAAIVNGGPVDKAWGKENAQNLPYGMPGIIGNDMRDYGGHRLRDYGDTLLNPQLSASAWARGAVGEDREITGDYGRLR
jgi:esterase FrsA